MRRGRICRAMLVSQVCIFFGRLVFGWLLGKMLWLWLISVMLLQLKVERAFFEGSVCAF